MGKRIEREKSTIRRMVELYCRHKLKIGEMPEEYVRLIDYASHRLEHCRFGERKTACRDCPVHCYAALERERIREVMRWAGTRMFFYNPMSAIRHLLNR